MAQPPERYAGVDTPALLLDLDQVERNIERYQVLAREAGVVLRPHAKAHKCIEVGQRQITAGAVGVCCAKLAEAEALAPLGNILVTTPVVDAQKIGRLVELARKAKVSVVVDDAANVAELAAACVQAQVDLGVLVDVDVGQARTGVQSGASAAELAAHVKRSGLRLAGMQGYQGRLQGVANLEERAALVREAMQKLTDAVRRLESVGLECAVRTGGGTGSFPIDLELKVLTEIQPGSYVTMDTNYAKVELGAGRHLGHPLTILASVVSRPTADRAVVDVGWKSASSDSGTPAVRGGTGLTFEFAGDEHGIIRSGAGRVELRLGERVELIPSHCDTTVNLYDSFVVHRGGRVEAQWPIVARGRSQ
jgi:D-serine deaminase-like pyridoxal phosphate-dependent protein